MENQRRMEGAQYRYLRRRLLGIGLGFSRQYLSILTCYALTRPFSHDFVLNISLKTLTI